MHNLEDNVITVPESETIKSKQLIWNHVSIAIEYNASIFLAVAIGEDFGKKHFDSKKIGLFICGGKTYYDFASISQ